LYLQLLGAKFISISLKTNTHLLNLDPLVQIFLLLLLSLSCLILSFPLLLNLRIC
jgi:hypothetical protein